MDQKRLFLAIAISLAILMGFQYLMPKPPSTAQRQGTQEGAQQAGQQAAQPAGTGAAPATASAGVPREVPRVKIEAPRVAGSISLLGARIDDLVLSDYHETLDRGSPRVRLLEPRSDPRPYYVQYGWSAAAGTTAKLPDNDTVWTASAPTLGQGKSVTLSWDNGADMIFEIEIGIDDKYMFAVEQRVRNNTGAAVQLYPWGRIRRDYKPVLEGYYVLFEGLFGVLNGKLQEMDYDTAKTDAEKRDARLRTEGKPAANIAFDATTTGGWAGLTDKYWLTALITNASVPTTMTFRHVPGTGPGPAADNYQVDFRTAEAQTIAPGTRAALPTHVFAGAKVVGLLQNYEQQLSIPMFDYAVDWGWFWFITRPIFAAIDWLSHHLGNFGLAILVFTVFAKLVFFPLANYSYRSMSRMKLLAPKMTELREKYKEDPQRMQKEIMTLYREEKVNPASGCLPIIVQIPVFFSLYKVIFVTIEMRQAPFYGWIKDLSAVDPTNIFNLFGLIPIDVAAYVSFLHVGIWPLLMGVTMWLQMQLNPPPPDPVQAKLFQLMPIGFTFMLAGFPAGLVIYWTWNNLLSIAQQWMIMKQTSLPKPNLAKT
ncbi:MAG: membrane protein insertase YidC [Acetobacteraceae bacterium]|nr:membrane protein insertase YidC [Acetobacteraceae bacterium]